MSTGVIELFPGVKNNTIPVSRELIKIIDPSTPPKRRNRRGQRGGYTVKIKSRKL
jgi:hypothetical protein